MAFKRRSCVRMLFVGVLSMLTVAGGGAIPIATAQGQAGYEWIMPGTGVRCIGGNAGGSTIGAWMQGFQPQVYDQLSDQQKYLVEHLYDGTTCSSATSAVQPLASVASPSTPTAPTATTLQSDYSTTPADSCPPALDLGTPQNPGCITGYSSWSVTTNFGSFDYDVTAQMEGHLYWVGDVGRWSAQATNFHNSHGSTWGMALQPENYTFQYGDHVGYGTSAHGVGSYTYANALFIVTLTNFATEDVHFGYKARFTQTPPPGWNVVGQDECWFTEFHANSASFQNGGWCASP